MAGRKKNIGAGAIKGQPAGEKVTVTPGKGGATTPKGGRKSKNAGKC